MLAVISRGKKKAFHDCFLSLGAILLVAAVKAASWQLRWKGLKHKKGLGFPVGFGMCSQALPNTFPGTHFPLLEHAWSAAAEPPAG